MRIRMRDRLMFLVALASMAVPALATKPFTVDQVRQILLAGQIVHRSDDAVAQQLADARLTSRLTGAALEQLAATCPGPKTKQILEAIAAESSFLEPAPNGLPGTPAPDIATQKAVMGRTVDYVVHTLPALPNFLATRVTEHYADTLRGLNTAAVERGDLFWLDDYRAPISFRDGREADDPALTSTSVATDKKDHAKVTKASVPPASTGGLSSWGEFGPILGIVLVDAAKGKLSWARWEQENGKPVAVFKFAVDRTVSHYSLEFCCAVSKERVNSSYGGPQARGGDQGPSPGMVKQSTPTIIHQISGYHGYLEVDPQTGTILRITIQADSQPGDEIQRAAMMVEYGPVKIGDAVHFCPTRSVAVSVSRQEYESSGTIQFINRLLLNDVQFVDYHRFGSESTLITRLPDVPDQSGASTEPAAAAPAEQGSVANSDAAAASAKSPQAPPVEVSALASPAPPVAPASSPVATEADKEIIVDALDSLPGDAGSATKAANGAADNGNGNGSGNSGGFTLKVTTRSVDIGLVADDKRGKPISDLKQDEIDLFDNGRKQHLIAFRHAAPGAVSPASSTPPPQSSELTDTFTNTAPTTAQVEDVPDTLILLMDESHLAYLDLNRARAEVLRFLAATRPTSRVALYAISEKGFHVIQDVTQDHALVEKRLAAWIPDASAVAQAQALDRRNRQQFDTVHNVQDLQSVNGNYIDAPLTMQTTDPELRQMGDNPLLYALEGMIALSRHFAPVPGHKSMAWISGDSVLADWEDKAVGTEKGGKQLEAWMQHTREALNEAHISLYAVDASAVEGGAVDASLKNRNIQLNQAAMDTASLGGGAAAARDNTPGRAAAQMQQDAHAIQGPVRQLAESTGGRAINRGSDLKIALDSIDQDSTGLYELGFDPDTPADGKFHSLQVRVPSRKNVVLRYRSGYLYTEETAGTQQRLQQAVWSPQDATGIALTAEAVTAGDSASGSSAVKLHIGFPGLALEQKDGRWADNLYIFVAQRDDAAQKAEVSGDTLRLLLKQATYETGMPAGIPYKRDVEVKSKLGSVRIIVVDGNSGKMGSVTLPSSALHP